METAPLKLYWPIGLTREMPGRTNRADLIETSLNDYTRHLMGDRAQVTVAWMDKTTSLLSSIYLGMVNDVYVVNDILKAEAAGHAAAIVGGHWDPGLYAAREAAGIPVVGPGEAAMMVAQTLGRRFAFLTVHEGYVPVIERNIRLYGCEANALAVRPVRRFGMTYENFVDCLEGRSDEFLSAFEKTALDCIEDGADVIIAGGQLFGPVFLANGFTTIANSGVPVVEVSACGLKLAKMLAELRDSIGLRKSEHQNAPFRTPPKEQLAATRTTFGLVRPCRDRRTAGARSVVKDKQ